MDNTVLTFSQFYEMQRANIQSDYKALRAKKTKRSVAFKVIMDKYEIRSTGLAHALIYNNNYRAKTTRPNN